MEYQIKPLDDGKVQITIILTTEEKTKFERRALRQTSYKFNLKGFRPGHIPDEVLRQQIDASALAEETMWEAIKETYPRLIKELALEVVGQPNLALQSLEPFTILATVAQLPTVELGKWETIKIKRREIQIEDNEVDKLVEQIRDSRASETAVVRTTQVGDRVTIDFEVSLGGIVLDGGKQTDYSVILGRGQLIPGFEDNLIGLKPNEEKRFELTFPNDYRQDLAGKKIQVWVKLKQIYERNLPEFTNEFVRTLGKFENIDDFRAKLKQNLLDEEAAREEQRMEREMLEALMNQTKFGVIPEILLTNETEIMIQELKRGVEEQGLEWQQYLQSIKKDEAALKKEFITPAERRIKVALIIRTLAKREKLEADEMAIEKEIAQTLKHYGGDERAAAQFNSEDYRNYIKQVITNRRVIEWLKKKLIV